MMIATMSDGAGGFLCILSGLIFILLVIEDFDLEAFRTGWGYFWQRDDPRKMWVRMCVLDVSEGHVDRFQLPGLDVYLLANGCICVGDRAYMPEVGFRVYGAICVEKMPGKGALLTVRNSLSSATHYFVFLSSIGWHRLVPADRTCPLWIDTLIMMKSLFLSCVVYSIVCLGVLLALPSGHMDSGYLVLSEIAALVAGAIGWFARRRWLPPLPPELLSAP